jgi:hypothetical protein|tara:strand:+ start:88 stop:1929 length:1842 start_codon:yes stop_codon:yes gene_type:complete
MAAKFGLLIDAKTKGENNIKRLGNSMQGVEGKAKNLGMAVRGVGTAFKALFAAAAVAGFTRFVKGAIDSADAFGKLSTRTGIAADKLQAFANAGKLADVSQSDLENGLRAFARTQAEAADGIATYADAYKKLGVGVTKADGSLKASDQLLGEIADKFADLPNGPEKAAIAMDIFGRSGSKLITLLNGGSEALERFNYETSENFAQNAEMFNDKITTLQIQFDGFRAQLADALLPALNSIVEAFSTMFSAENDFTGFFQAVEIAIRAVGVSIAATIMGITEIVALIKAAATAVGAVTLGRFGEAGQAISDYMSGAGKRYTGNKEVMDLLLGRIEAPTNYGGGGSGLDPVTLQGGGTGTGTGTNGKPPVQVSADVLRLTKEINAARLAGNKLAEVDLGYDLEIQQLKEKGLTGNNLALEQSNLLTQYTLDRLDAVNGLANAQDNLNNKTDKYKITLDQVKDTLANQITSAIEGLIDGTKSLGESLSGLLKTFASMFLRSGIGSLVGQIFPSAKGNVFAQNGIVPYAKGGYIGRPTMALMGEAGPEAVLPLRRGRSGRLGVETSGGGVGSVVVNVDASGSSVQGNEPDANQLGRVIGQAVQAELIKQKRPGGLLTR